MAIRFSFMVVGRLATKGSTSSFVSKRTGRVVTHSANKNLAAWEMLIRATALKAKGSKRFEGPVFVRMMFHLKRPKSHYGARGELVQDAPLFCIPKRRYDLDKLVRAVLDGMDGVAYGDDSQVARIEAAKVWDHKDAVLVEVREAV